MKQITCPHCGDTYPDFDVAHVCSQGPYAPKLKPKMNERIKELIEKAEDPEHGFIIPEKFAELIVKECIVVAADAKSLEAAVRIKQHFGVEE